MYTPRVMDTHVHHKAIISNGNILFAKLKHEKLKIRQKYNVKKFAKNTVFNISKIAFAGIYRWL